MTATTATELNQAAAVGGTVHGGQSPIQGALVSIYVTKASATDYGQAATLISTATSDAGGNFLFPTSVTSSNCAAGNQVYMTAAGGYPSGSPTLVNNSSLLMVALGDCANVNSSTRAVINEVTTVAAGYALSSFMTTSASGSIYKANVSAPAANNAQTGTTAAAAGLVHAFMNAATLADSVSGMPQTVKTISVAGSSASGIIPTNEINTLADILESCVNSATGSDTCTNLYNFTPSISDNPPANTLQAMIDLARNPYPGTAAMTQATGLFSLISSSPAFVPVLTAQPNDWSLAIVYKTHAPYYMTLDANDTVYSSISPISIAGMSAYGVATPAYGYVTGIGRGIAADAIGNVWLANNSGVNIFQYNASTGGTPISYPMSTSSIYSPFEIAIDASNNVWVSGQISGTSFGNNVRELAYTASTQAYALNYTGEAPSTLEPYGLTIDANQNIWMAPYGTYAGVITNLNAGTSAAPSYATVGTTGTTISAVFNGSATKPYGLVIDASGNAWYGITGSNTNTTSGLEEVIPNTTTGDITSITPQNLITGTVLGATSTNLPGIDGAGTIYVADNVGAGARGLHVYSTTTPGIGNGSQVLSPPQGYIGCYLSDATVTTCGTGPNSAVYYAKSVLVDSTGSVWTANNSNGPVQLIGLGAPTWPLLSTGKPGLSPGYTTVAVLP